MIKEIKPPRSKSSLHVRNVLISALEMARKDKTTVVCVVMSTSMGIYKDYAITPKGSYTDAIAGLTKLSREIEDAWDDENS